MRKLLVFLILAAALISVSSAQQAKTTPASRTAKWISGTSIHYAYSYPDSASFSPERKAGKNWLFEYTYKAPENPDMTDDEFTEVICFEVPPVKGNTFTLKGEKLAQSNGYYMLGCFCKDRGFKRISGGTLKGTRINSKTWKLEFDVTFKTKEGELKKKYKGSFTRSQN